MEALSKSQKARIAIRTFKIHADSLTLQGTYKPSGKAGQKLLDSLRQLSPEIYGSMTDERIVELKGLEYVIDRMPKGIEKCTRIILTAQEDFNQTSFKKIVPLKRRRVSYAVSEYEMCLVITRGTSEIYDILTHITFLNNEAEKIYNQAFSKTGGINSEWAELERVVSEENTLSREELDQAIWNLSIILGRTYRETRDSYESFEKNRIESKSNNGFFKIIYNTGMRIKGEREGGENPLTLYFTPSLHEMIGHHKYALLWATSLKKKICDLALQDRPVHVICANMHSIRNLLYGAGALKNSGKAVPDDIYGMVREIKSRDSMVIDYGRNHGCFLHEDRSGSNIDVNIIDLAEIDGQNIHPGLSHLVGNLKSSRVILLVLDYAFGTQAFEIMDEMLRPFLDDKEKKNFNFQSISIMGKAGVLAGRKGDIMLAEAHVMEGTPDNYIVNNDFDEQDFDNGVTIFSGPMVTVLGTSLQNKAMLERFHTSSWCAVGLEMEGGHYQRAISAAVIQKHIEPDIKIRYAYYASDNPLVSGQTLASGPMGEEGIVPTYMISKIILQKIINDGHGDH
jgi:hypothetical protein